MLNRLRETSLTDVQIGMNYMLSIVALLVYVATFFLPPDYSFIIIVTCVFMANFPYLFFFVGICLDKRWILSIIGIENDHVIPKFKEKHLAISGGLLLFLVMFLIRQSALDPFMFSTIAYAIFFTARMLTQVTGFYIYWLARMNNDTKLKASAPDNIILERSRENANFNYNCGKPFGGLLFVSLLIYLMVESFVSITPSVRMGAILYSVALFSWVVLFFILAQIFDTSANLLHLTSQAKYEYEYRNAIGKSLQNRLFIVKFLLLLFLLMQIVVLIHLISL